ncbi:MAG: hypothetical protein HY842_20040 [Bacteroidetes bacterium]|nr:hypothetical protein [Bacteroidota bacterium]
MLTGAMFKHIRQSQVVFGGFEILFLKKLFPQTKLRAKGRHHLSGRFFNNFFFAKKRGKATRFGNKKARAGWHGLFV